MNEQRWLGWTLEDIKNDPNGYIDLVRKTHPRPVVVKHKPITFRRLLNYLDPDQALYITRYLLARLDK